MSVKSGISCLVGGVAFTFSAIILTVSPASAASNSNGCYTQQQNSLRAQLKSKACADVLKRAVEKAALAATGTIDSSLLDSIDDQQWYDHSGNSRSNDADGPNRGTGTRGGNSGVSGGNGGS